MIDEIAISGRVIERLIVVISAAISLGFGWHLFKIGIVSAQSANLEGQGFTFNLKKVGPGVFFALFGTTVLALSLINPLELNPSKSPVKKDDESIPPVIRYAEEDSAKTKEYVKALNTVIDTVSEDTYKDLKPIDLQDIVAANKILKDYRAEAMIQRFGSENWNLWKKKGEDYLSNPLAIPDNERMLLEAMKPWMTDRIRFDR